MGISNWASAIQDLFSKFQFTPSPRRRKFQSIVSAEVLEQRLCLSGNPVVYNVELQNDTGDDGGDDITRDPTLVGEVSVGGDFAYTDVEFDFDGDGIVDDWAMADEYGHFEYNPGNSLEYGEVTINVRALALDSTTGQMVHGDWVSITFTFVAPPDPEVLDISLKNDTGVDGDKVTMDPTLIGQVSVGGDYGYTDVEFDIDGDGNAEDWTMSDGEGNFEYNPAGYLGAGEVTIYVRAMALDSMTGQMIYGDWVPFTFTYESME